VSAVKSAVDRWRPLARRLYGRYGTRALIGALVLAATAVVVVVAAMGDRAEETHPVTPTAVDPENEVRFRFRGPTLRASIAHQPNVTQEPTIEQSLFDKRIRAWCRARGPDDKEATETSIRRWPEGAVSVDYRFARDISGQVTWCLLEHEKGGDIAFARFPGS
jgi:hypothetical protein